MISCWNVVVGRACLLSDGLQLLNSKTRSMMVSRHLLSIISRASHLTRISPPTYSTYPRSSTQEGIKSSLLSSRRESSLAPVNSLWECILVDHFLQLNLACGGQSLQGRSCFRFSWMESWTLTSLGESQGEWEGWSRIPKQSRRATIMSTNYWIDCTWEIFL